MSSNYEKFLAYVKKNRYNSTFSANNVREKLNVPSSVIPALFSKAVRDGLISCVGQTPSDVPNHKGSSIGLYTRTYSSY